MTTAITSVCECRNLKKTYGTGDAVVHAVNGIDLTLTSQSFTAIMGPSGSGKTTLMHVLAGLDTATSGSVKIGSTEVSGLSDAQLTKVRRNRVGFIFQQFNLVDSLTAEQNIILPAKLAGVPIDRHRLAELATQMGIANRLRHKPSELSGGQQQRVAIVRALLTSPDVIFADEPTGALDSMSSTEVLVHLRNAVNVDGQTVVMVTHDPVAASYADQVLLLSDGRIAGQIYNPTRDNVLDALRELEA